MQLAMLPGQVLPRQSQNPLHSRQAFEILEFRELGKGSHIDRHKYPIFSALP